MISPPLQFESRLGRDKAFTRRPPRRENLDSPSAHSELQGGPPPPIGKFSFDPTLGLTSWSEQRIPHIDIGAIHGFLKF